MKVLVKYEFIDRIHAHGEMVMEIDEDDLEEGQTLKDFLEDCIYDVDRDVLMGNLRQEETASEYSLSLDCEPEVVVP